MDRLIRHLAEKLYKQMRFGTRGAMALPKGCQLNYEFEVDCYLELMIRVDGKLTEVTCSRFGVISSDGWIDIEYLEEKIGELFEGREYTNKDINKFFKD